MLTAILVFVIAYLLIASGRISHSIVAVAGAMVVIFLGIIPEHHALEHIDLEVILLLAGMMSIAHVMGGTGIFDWAALRSAQLVRGNGIGTLLLLSLQTAVASAFLDNVTVVVFAVPITIAVCKALDFDPIPFLLAQVFASNIGGSATVVGDPPNIIIASAADIGFVNFMVHIAPVSLVSMVALSGLLFFWFRNGIQGTEEARIALMKRNPSETIKDPALLKKSLVVFAFIFAGFLTHEILGVGPAIVAISGAATLILVARIEPREVLQHVEWTTLAFFVGLFILVGSLVETGVTLEIQTWLVDLAGGNERNLSLMLIWFAGAASAIVDNIPFTTTMVEIVKEVQGHSADGTVSPLWWALALGADLGGNATLVGASANVIVVGLARVHGYPINFIYFFKYGIVISGVTLAISTLYVWLRYYS